MCNRMVLWMLKREVKEEIFFAPLEGDTAVKILAEDYEQLMKLDTVVFVDETQVYVRSDAAIQALCYTRYFAWLGGAMKIFPRTMRDAVYVWIAERRKRIWSTCPVIPNKFRQRFLD